MLLISHRGNLAGRIPECENNPEYLQAALEQGYHVECDVWYNQADGHLWLGHDDCQYEVPDYTFFRKPEVWAHCKDIQALKILMNIEGTNCFWHQTDHFTLTSKGYIWCYPRHYVEGGIVVIPELMAKRVDMTGAKGICSDYIDWWKNDKSLLRSRSQSDNRDI